MALTFTGPKYPCRPTKNISIISGARVIAANISWSLPAVHRRWRQNLEPSHRLHLRRPDVDRILVAPSSQVELTRTPMPW